MQQPTNTAWPYYFQPARPGSPAVARPRIPTDLIDVLYLRDIHSGATELVIVMRCLGGALDVATGAAVATLPADIQAQLKAVQINQRHAFRTIAASDLSIFALDALEQAAQARGFNDAVDLHGRMQARLVANGGRVEVLPVAQAGRLTVGRIDLLHALRSSIATAFSSPQVVNEQAYQWLVPAAPIDAIQRGSGLTLIYPVLDPATFTGIDTSFIALRVAYDLLARIQHDLLLEHHDHPFAHAVLPVPSRHRLETELAADGYEVCGDEAIKRVDAAEPAAQAGTLLARLRRMAQQWSAPRIILPPQATLHEYQVIIDHLLPTLVTHADQAMMDALNRCTSMRSAPALVPLARPAPPVVPPATGQTQPLPPLPQTPPRPSRQTDWRNDFAAQPSPALPGAAQPPGTTSASPTLTTTDDWTQDFRTETGLNAVPPPATDELDRPAARDWSADFTPSDVVRKPADTTHSNDWTSDFE